MPVRQPTTPVRDVMTAAPMTVTPATEFDELLELFARHDVGAFPVVEDTGLLRGIVTKLDLLRAFVGGRDAATLAHESAERLDLHAHGIHARALRRRRGRGPGGLLEHDDELLELRGRFHLGVC